MMASARVLSPSQICWYHSLSRNWEQKIVEDFFRLLCISSKRFLASASVSVDANFRCQYKDLVACLWFTLYTVINTVKKGIPEHPSWQDVYSGIMVLKPWLLYQIIPFRTMRKTIFLIKSSAISYCPVCMEEFSYRDSCKRILLQEGHERHVCIIRRMKCTKCGILRKR